MFFWDDLEKSNRAKLAKWTPPARLGILYGTLVDIGTRHKVQRPLCRLCREPVGTKGHFVPLVPFVPMSTSGQWALTSFPSFLRRPLSS
jgi:hypothetical protein